MILYSTHRLKVWHCLIRGEVNQNSTMHDVLYVKDKSEVDTIVESRGPDNIFYSTRWGFTQNWVGGGGGEGLGYGDKQPCLMIYCLGCTVPYTVETTIHA